METWLKFQKFQHMEEHLREAVDELESSWAVFTSYLANEIDADLETSDMDDIVQRFRDLFRELNYSKRREKKKKKNNYQILYRNKDGASCGPIKQQRSQVAVIHIEDVTDEPGIR